MVARPRPRHPARRGERPEVARRRGRLGGGDQETQADQEGTGVFFKASSSLQLCLAVTRSPDVINQ